MRPRRLVPALLLAGLLGCGGEPVADAPDAAAGELRQPRSDRALHRVQVTVTSGLPLRVTAVTLTAGGFAPTGTVPVDVSLPVGSPLDLPVTYGAPDCAAAPGPAVAVLATDELGDLRLDLDDGGLVARLHEAECVEQALREAVDLAVSPELVETVVDGVPTLTGALLLTRRVTGERVVLDGLGANVVLTVRSDTTAAPLRVLGPDEASLSVPLVLTPSRCEAHALAESKRTSLVTAYLGLGDRAPRLVTVTPDDATRRTVEEFASRGWGKWSGGGGAMNMGKLLLEFAEMGFLRCENKQFVLAAEAPTNLRPLIRAMDPFWAQHDLEDVEFGLGR